MRNNISPSAGGVNSSGVSGATKYQPPSRSLFTTPPRQDISTNLQDSIGSLIALSNNCVIPDIMQATTALDRALQDSNIINIKTAAGSLFLKLFENKLIANGKFYELIFSCEPCEIIISDAIELHECHLNAAGVRMTISRGSIYAICKDAVVIANGNRAIAYASAPYAKAGASADGAIAIARDWRAPSYAEAPGATALTEHPDATAYANVAGAIAKATVSGTVACALCESAIAQSIVPGARAHASEKGAIAYAVVPGAVASCNTGGMIIEWNKPKPNNTVLPAAMVRGARSIAATQNQLDIIKALLKLNTNLKIFTLGMVNVLENVVNSNTLVQDLVLQIDWGGDKTLVTPLHLAACSNTRFGVEAINLLLRLGAKIEEEDINGNTPLHYAAKNDAILTVRTLLKMGAKRKPNNDRHMPADMTKDLVRIKPLLMKEYNDNAASDTDSEDDANYAYDDDARFDEMTEGMHAVNLGVETPGKCKVKDNMIAHYRGLHFNPQHFTRAQRKTLRLMIQLQQMRRIPNSGLFSLATYELAKVNQHFPDMSKWLSVDGVDKILLELSDNEKALLAQSAHVLNKIALLQQTGEVDYCLGVHSRGTREKYQSRYIELLQVYVNTYNNLVSDLAAALTRKMDGRSSERTKEKWEILKQLGICKIPFVSMSEDCKQSIEYATAFINYDKQTHTIRTGTNPLTPQYQSDGHPRYPYLGVLYVSLHTPNELSDITKSTRILDLYVQNLFDQRCGPGGNHAAGRISERERVFIAHVAADHVKLAKVIRVPSFFGGYKPYYASKYGLSESTYRNFQRKLSDSSGSKDEIAKIQEDIIALVIEYYAGELENTARKLADKSGGVLCYLDENNQPSSVITPTKDFKRK